MFEVFDPRHGRAYIRTKSERLARFLAWLWDYDYDAV